MKSTTVQWTSIESGKLKEWPEFNEVPTLKTLTILKEEHDLTQLLYKDIPHKARQHYGHVMFCGEKVHSFVINGRKWDCINGWNNEVKKVA